MKAKSEMTSFHKNILKILNVSETDAKDKYNLHPIETTIDKTCQNLLYKIIQEPDHPVTSNLLKNPRSTSVLNLYKTKIAKTKKAKAPSKAAIKPAMSNIAEPAPAMSPDTGMMPSPMMKKGGKAKKYADGGIVDNIKAVGKKAYENVMGTPEQNKAAAEQEKRIAEKDPSSYEAKYRKLTGKKEGGKACQ